MYIASSYVRAESLDEAWELNQKRNNKIMGGNCWLRMGKSNNINTIISLSKLGLDKIEENDSEFKIGAMVTLRQIETWKPAGSLPWHCWSRRWGRALSVGYPCRFCSG